MLTRWLLRISYQMQNSSIWVMYHKVICSPLSQFRIRASGGITGYIIRSFGGWWAWRRRYQNPCITTSIQPFAHWRNHYFHQITGSLLLSVRCMTICALLYSRSIRRTKLQSIHPRVWTRLVVPIWRTQVNIFAIVYGRVHVRNSVRCRASLHPLPFDKCLSWSHQE